MTRTQLDERACKSVAASALSAVARVSLQDIVVIITPHQPPQSFIAFADTWHPRDDGVKSVVVDLLGRPWVV